MNGNRAYRRQLAQLVADRLNLDGDELAAGADAAWSNLNPQTVNYGRALSVAASVLLATRDRRPVTL